MPHTSVENRHNYNEVVLGYDQQQAKTEAERCLDCHQYCSLCVGVCPNLALQTWQSSPFEVHLPELHLGPAGIETHPGKTWRIKQAFQIAVFTDLCNECGNCTTFCPTAGVPYRDKPRLYLERDQFEAQNDNAFMVFREADHWAMDARWQGETHHIELGSKLDYQAPLFSARLNPDTFEPERIKATDTVGDKDTLSLEPCAVMYVLLNGLKQSLPYVPTASRDGPLKTGKIVHPGYTE